MWNDIWECEGLDRDSDFYLFQDTILALTCETKQI